MPDETQQPKTAIIEPGASGARLRTAGADATTEANEPRRRGPSRAAKATEAPAGEPDEAPHPLLRFSADDLRAELARRQRQVEYLKLQRGALLRQVAEVEAQIGRLSPSGRSAGVPGPRAPRARRAPATDNAVSLAEVLAGVVAAGDVVTPAQAAERVLASGYKSNAQRFGVLVATALSKDKRFERLGRGQYRRTG